MQNNNEEEFKFIKYEPVQGEKHLGVATLLYNGKLILRYKIVPTKEGGGYFPAAPAIKLGEKWLDGHALDSQLDKEEVEHLIRHNVQDFQRSAHHKDAMPSMESVVQDDLPF